MKQEQSKEVLPGELVHISKADYDAYVLITKIFNRISDNWDDKTKTAVNETYGRGYNPAAMEQLYKALEAVRDFHDRCAAKNEPVLSPHWESVVKTALQNSKL